LFTNFADIYYDADGYGVFSGLDDRLHVYAANSEAMRAQYKHAENDTCVGAVAQPKSSFYADFMIF